MKKIKLNNKELDLYILHTGHPDKGWLADFNIKPKVNSNISIISYSNYNYEPELFKQNVNIIKPQGDFKINPDKIDLFCSVLNNIDTEYTLLLDSVDCLILKDLDENFIKRFEDFNVDILYCWDRNIYPHMIFKENESLVYLCAGIVFGRTEKIRKTYNEIKKLKNRYSIENKHERAEQFWLRLYYNYFNREDCKVAIDSNLELFGTIRGYESTDENYYYSKTSIERPDTTVQPWLVEKYSLNNHSLVFLLPTCEPLTIKKFLLPSLQYIRPIADKISFAICFQPPYTENQKIEVLHAFEGFDIKYIEKQYDFKRPNTPLMKMRQDCSLLYPQADYYALLDDDMQFEKGIDEYYSNIIKSMNSDRQLSVITLSKRDLFFENKFFTNAGIVYRGGKYYGFEGFVPHSLPKNCITLIPYEGEDLVELVGGHQDELCAMIRLACGERSKNYINVPTRHRENRDSPGYIQHGWVNAEKQENSVNNFIKKYFNPDYSIKSRNLLFCEKLKEKVNQQKGYAYDIIKNQFTMSLDGRRKGTESEHATVRAERCIMDESIIGIDYDFQIIRAEDYKEFTVLQVHSLDDPTYPVIPIIRFCIIDQALYITYKDNNNVNHYTKIDNFEINKRFKIKVIITPTTIEINNGKWKYERWCKKYRIRYGLYTQTEDGQYTIQINSIKGYKQKDNWWEN